MLVSKWFVKNIDEMGPDYVEPVTDTIESIYDGRSPRHAGDLPVVYWCRPHGVHRAARAQEEAPRQPAVMSMGEGQEEYAVQGHERGCQERYVGASAELRAGLDLMVKMEDFLANLYEQEGFDKNFRLFITALPEKTFPLGLLQMSTKVTNEPPPGLKAGVLKSYTVLVDQERLERVDTMQWRQLLFALCFMHSTVQERRKFGPLGWGIPYEYNNGDLTACILFLEKHLYNGSISGPPSSTWFRGAVRRQDYRHAGPGACSDLHDSCGSTQPPAWRASASTPRTPSSKRLATSSTRCPRSPS